MAVPFGKRFQLIVPLYVFRWNRPALPGRKGQLCKVNARGKMNSCEIEFLDGTRAIVSRNAIKKYRGERDSGQAGGDDMKKWYRVWMKGQVGFISPSPNFRAEKIEEAKAMMRQIEREEPRLKGKLVVL